MRNADDLRKLIAHEYIESRLMQSGLPYRVPGELTSYRYGAHELSSLEHTLDFSHWQIMARRDPLLNINHDLSNLDEVAYSILDIEGI